MHRILVTGGAGFIGSHTCLVLLKNGFEIIVLDSFINSSERSLERVQQILSNEKFNCNLKIKIIKGDVRDKNIIEDLFLEAINEFKPINAVLHFAGLKAVEESFNLPLDYWDTNICGTINLLKVMKKYNCKTIVFSSTAAIYKRSDNTYLNEDSDIKPINPYGITKHNVEQILRNLFDNDSKNWRIACLRYFNPIGAHESGLLGEFSSSIPNNIFPYINLVAFGKIKELKIFGKDWPTSDGTCIRDYIHVMDLAEGHLEALKYIYEGEPKFITLNLGTGIGTSVMQLINTFSRVNKVNVPFSFTEKRKGDECSVIADNALAKKLLGWSTKRNLIDMCKDGWNWQLKNPNGY